MKARNITTSTTTTLKAKGDGFLHAIVVNKKGTGGNTAAIYDGDASTGTLIATIDTTAQAGAFLYDFQFHNGCTIVTATGGQADLTAIWQ